MLFFGVSLSLLEERREDGGQRDHHADKEERQSHGSPERAVAGRTRLLRDVRVRDAERDHREDEKGAGEDVEIASHGCLILRRRRQRQSKPSAKGPMKLSCGYYCLVPQQAYEIL